MTNQPASIQLVIAGSDSKLFRGINNNGKSMVRFFTIASTMHFSCKSEINCGAARGT
jgi:hypothetical protein